MLSSSASARVFDERSIGRAVPTRSAPIILSVITALPEPSIAKCLKSVTSTMQKPKYMKKNP